MIYPLKWKALSALLLTIFVTSSPAWADDQPISTEPTCTVGLPAAADAAQVEELPSDLFHIVLRNGMQFDLSGRSPSEQARLNRMTEEQRATFFARRKEYLGYLAKFLAFPRLMGATSIAGKVISGCFRKASTNSAEDIISVHLGAAMNDAGKLQRRGYQFISQILQMADTQLWQDANTIVSAPYKEWIIPVGISNGIGFFNLGAGRFHGVQFNIGYDFATKKGYIDRKLLYQKANKIGVMLETMVSFGIMYQYSNARNLPQEELTLLNLPAGLAYRSGTNSVATGLFAGISLLDVAAVTALCLDQPELSIVLGGLSRVSLASFYTTQTVEQPLELKRRWAAFKNWTKKLLGPAQCENSLMSVRQPDWTYGPEADPD